jgi:hypothetical protein
VGLIKFHLKKNRFRKLFPIALHPLPAL